jgi:hypothetical protein
MRFSHGEAVMVLAGEEGGVKGRSIRVNGIGEDFIREPAFTPPYKKLQPTLRICKSV